MSLDNKTMKLVSEMLLRGARGLTMDIQTKVYRSKGLTVCQSGTGWYLKATVEVTSKLLWFPEKTATKEFWLYNIRDTAFTDGFYFAKKFESRESAEETLAIVARNEIPYEMDHGFTSFDLVDRKF